MTMTPFSSDVERAILAETPIRSTMFFRTLGSTNDYAKELLCSEAAKESMLTFPLLISAEEQTAGRGRGAKKWWTGKDSIAVSLVLDLREMQLDRNELPNLSPLTAKVVCDTIGNVIGKGHTLEVHAPNDVYLNGKKVCGILIESPTPDYAIFGIGINTNNSITHLPEEYRNVPITTLFDTTGKLTSHSVLLVDLFQRFFKKLKPADTATGISLQDSIAAYNP